MDPALIVLLIFLGLMVFAWLVEKFDKPPANEPREPKDDSTSLPQKTRMRRKRSIVRLQQQEDVFPDYDPNHNDELEWRNLVEVKFRKYAGYPPDWERRRALVFLRDGGKCQGEEHRGGTCGRLLCEANQIWNFKYGVRLLVEAHVDHITPTSAGGDHSLENLQLLCPKCHALKHGDWELATMGGLRIPRGRGRSKYLRKYFFTRKAPKPPDERAPF